VLPGDNVFLEREDALALYTNGLNANDSDLEFSTLPFAFVAREVFALDLRSAAGLSSGLTRASERREQIELVIPETSLLALWDRQVDFEEHLRLTGEAPDWLSTPTPVVVPDVAKGALSPSRRTTHFNFEGQAEPGAPAIVRSRFPAAGEGGGARPASARLDEAGQRAGRVLHFDFSPNSLDGHDLGQGPLVYAPDDPRIAWQGASGWLQPLAVSFWMRLSATDGVWFDARQALDGDRLVLSQESGSLRLQVFDGPGDHPDTPFREVQELNVPLLGSGSTLGPGTWLHAALDVRGTRPGQVDLRLDGLGLGQQNQPYHVRRTGLTQLSGALAGDATVIAVVSTAGFPDRCVLRIGNELIEARKSGPGSFDAAHITNGLEAGFGGRLARERFESLADGGLVNLGAGKADNHPAGTSVELYGYSHALASNLPSGGGVLTDGVGLWRPALVSGVNGQPGVEINIQFPAGDVIPIGVGIDPLVEMPQTLELSPCDPTVPPAEALSGFSPGGGYAMVLQDRVVWTLLGELPQTLEIPFTAAGSPLYGYQVLRYSGVNGNSLVIAEWNVQAAELPNLAQQVLPNFGPSNTGKAFVIEYGGLVLAPDALNGDLGQRVIVVPISLPYGAGTDALLPALNGISEFAQITRSDLAELSEWVRYDTLVGGQLVRDNPAALLELYAIAVGAQRVADANPPGPDGDDDDDDGGGVPPVGGGGGGTPGTGGGVPSGGTPGGGAPGGGAPGGGASGGGASGGGVAAVRGENLHRPADEGSFERSLFPGALGGSISWRGLQAAGEATLGGLGVGSNRGAVTAAGVVALPTPSGSGLLALRGAAAPGQPPWTNSGPGPIHSAFQTGASAALWQPNLGVDELADEPYARALWSHFQFRGVLNTFPHQQPPGTPILPVVRLAFPTGLDPSFGWPGRFDPVFALDGTPNDPGLPGTVFRAHRASNHVQYGWDWPTGSAPLTVVPLPGVLEVEDAVIQQNLLVALSAPLGVPVPFGAPGGDVSEMRGVARLTKFPSGELPRRVSTVAFGEPGGNSAGYAGLIDEITFGSTQFGQGLGSLPGNGYAGSALVLGAPVSAEATDWTVIPSLLRNALGTLVIPSGNTLLAQLPSDGGLFRVGNELVLYQAVEPGTGTVSIGPNGRGALGTTAQPHAFGAPIEFLSTVEVSSLAGGIDADSAEIQITDASGFPEQGTVLIGQELLHFTQRSGTLLRMPRGSSVPGAKDGRGSALLRGRFGTTPGAHPAGAAVVLYPFRFWDRWAERADAPELGYFGLQMTTPEARIERFFFESQPGPVGGARLLVLSRSDPSLPWDSVPAKGSGLERHTDGDPAAGGLPMPQQRGQADWRVFVQYAPGSFDPLTGQAHGWKETAELTRFGATYLAPSRVLGRVLR
jgi:hypothetical protein